MAIGRLWEVDAARGIAIVMMLISNLVLDLAVFLAWNIDISSGFWLYFARATAALFILVAGISLTLSHSRLERKTYRKYLFRGLRIFSWGLAITAVTMVLFPGNTIWFGILHLIGFSIIISYPLLRTRPLLAFLLGLAIILVGFNAESIPISSPWLLWLGLAPGSFTSFDYVPVFPWFGCMLIGISLGNVLYTKGERLFKIGNFSSNLAIKTLAALGRNSLLIYLVHQPILVGALFLLASA
ncbi:MAG: DUF1624 domain-containing protein [Candidatus Aenigmarchaeota archaeon]|nr:DUF1624 domain-containing protein [Candidatus Aenigmarchaeota archaeon]